MGVYLINYLLDRFKTALKRSLKIYFRSKSTASFGEILHFFFVS